MNSPYENVSTETERKLVKRGTFVAGIAYAVVLVGIFALAGTGDGLPNKAESDLTYSIDGIAAPVYVPTRSSAPRASMLAPSTDGLNTGLAAANGAYSSIVPFSEENELFDNFQVGTGDSGFAPPPQAGAKSATEKDQRTAHTARP